jgi:hypothetical protein
VSVVPESRCRPRSRPFCTLALTRDGTLGHTPPTHEPLLLLSKPGMMVLGQ